MECGNDIVELGEENIGRRNFGDGVVENQKFLSPTFSFSLSYFLLNFGNGIVEIHSLSLHL